MDRVAGLDNIARHIVMALFALFIGASLLPWTLSAPPTYSDSIFSPYIAQKYARVGSKYRAAQFPHTTAANGTWTWNGADWWTSGFLPASFYLLNERKTLCPKNKNLSSVDWLTLGRHWSDSLVPLQSGNGQGHDQGFLSLPYMEELRVNPTNTSAVKGVQNFAKLLAARYSSIVGCTRSWNSNAPDFLVIMDNMMNLELLFKAADLTANRTLIDIAIKHADTTIKNHIRPDGSSYHVVDYNQNTGAVIKKYTAQGYADNSTWSRGKWACSFRLGLVMIALYRTSMGYLWICQNVQSHDATSILEYLSANGESIPFSSSNQRRSSLGFRCACLEPACGYFCCYDYC
ncbi:hypothetical protein FS749_004012 [Ceratobasidium sp. UAMH 11750]|nr:hypothetical protein FS749_004012 [Ceratobasidium sp. UAMH 11750]